MKKPSGLSHTTSRALIFFLSLIALMALSWGVARWRAQTTDPTSAQDYLDGVAGRAGSPTDRRIGNLQSQLQTNPEDWPAYSQLGAAYLQKARETGDPTYYQKAEEALQTALDHEPGDYAAVSALGELALARHDFRGALEWGEWAAGLNPNRAPALGVIVDAQVELGRYDDAVRTLQTMVDLRPDLSSFSRVSYLRELNGDVEGAIKAMRMALDAGGPHTENTHWTRVQLGHLYFNSGRLADAEAQYQSALALDADYAPAQAGMARVHAARGQYDEAIRLYIEATNRMPLAEYVIALGEVYEQTGRPDEAQKQFDLVRAIEQLYIANGVNTDLEMALFAADHPIEGQDMGEGVRRARQGQAERPTIYSADVLAWALYQDGQDAEAHEWAQKALALGAQDALKFYHAGMIARRVGEQAKAREYLERALRINPYFSLKYAAEAQTTLKQLQAGN